jgi:nucleotide-binding universal stress UspA family protein
MNEQARIMSAVDLSWRSEGAFDYAVALAKSRRAQLDLVFAVSPRNPFSWRARERVARLAEFRRRASAADVSISVTVQHGRPADVILQHATSATTRSPQLIVLGAPSRRGVERLRSPSVAQAVVHQIDHPTLVVPGSEIARCTVHVPFRRILCAIDFSPASTSALDEALRILRQDGGTIRLLHVVDIVQSAVPRIALEFPAIDYTEPLRDDARRRLRTVLPLSQDVYGRVHVQVDVGLVVDQIVRNANELKADLVVLGVRKRGRVARLLGSTTGAALRRLRCPVLVVPQPGSTASASMASGDGMRLAA